MKLLVVGADTPYAIERHYLKYISEMNPGIEIEFFAAQNRFLNYYNRNTFRKIWYRLGFSGILSEINGELWKKVEGGNWDAVLVFKGMEIFPSTLKKIKERSIKIINYNPDNPFLFSGRGSGNRNITDSIELYDLYLSYDHQVIERLDTECRVRSALLPFGFELEDAVYNRCLESEEIVKVCFVGNPDHQRASWISGLAEAGIPIDVFGHGWNRFTSHPKIQINPAVYGEEFWKVLRQYRVQLNLMRQHNPQSHNMRSFEIPAVGGIQLAPITPDHLKYFIQDKEIYLFKNLDDCKSHIDKILELTPQQSLDFRNAARERSISSGYSYRDRAAQVVGLMQGLLDG